VVSRDAIFVCGPDMLHWKDWLFATLNWVYLSKPDVLPLLDAQHRELLITESWVEVLVSRMFVHRFSKSLGGEDTLRCFDLLYLVELTRDHGATDPRDKIYALLGVDEVHDISIDPDYTKSTSEVYRDFVVKYIEIRHDLSIICKGGIATTGLDEPLGLSSWIPDSRHSNPKNKTIISSRMTHFNASKSFTPIYNFCFGSQTLSSSGVICDIITDSRPHQDPPSDVDWTIDGFMSRNKAWSDLALSLAGVPQPTGISQYQAFFRTVIEDESGYGYGRPEFRDEDDRQGFFRFVIGFLWSVGLETVAAVQTDPNLLDRFTYWNKIHAKNKFWAKSFALWRGALLEPNISSLPVSDEALVEPFFATSGSTGNLELPEMFAAYDDDLLERHVRGPFLDRLAEKHSRSFFVSSKGYMGLGPLDAKVGDEICVLLGCNQPLVIRRVGDHHLVVGQCYVYGMMFGEMMDEMEAGKLKVETFHFK
jgi:hypothetical protein